jgi:hypothetical protein
MLILSLLDPQQSQVIQQWRFEQEPLVRIGRAYDNQVVINSDLISRYHLEIHQIQPQQWQLISKGANGTFFQGKRIEQLILSSSIDIQLAQGGPRLKFELLPTAKIETLQISAIAQSPNPELPNSFSNEPDSRINILETILGGLNAQFSVSFLNQRKAEIHERLAAIQTLQVKLKAEINLGEKNSQYSENLLKILLENYEDLEFQRKSLKEFQPRIEEVQQLLETFQQHLEANATVAQQLPTQSTRVEQLIEGVRQQLQDLDQELGRIHAQHLLDSAKRIFSL